MVGWAGRYAEALDRRGGELSRRAAAACRRVPAQPARDLFEALQAIVLVHHAIHLEGQGCSVSIGLLDRVLAPFAQEVERDVDAAVDLLAAFLL